MDYEHKERHREVLVEASVFELLTLELGDIFMVEGMVSGDYYDSVMYREEYLKVFEKAIAQVLSPDIEQPASSVPINTENLDVIPAIKGYVVPELFAVLKDYFAPEEQVMGFSPL